MARRKRWEWSGATEGYGEVRLLSWKYYMDFVYQEMLSYESYIWRGQRCDDWELESTLDRLIRDTGIARRRQMAFREKHLENFKYAVRGRRGPNPPTPEGENEWWALGQHHGLATPLLDWTLSPFVAAYFAFISTGEKQTRNRVVFALHKPTVETAVKRLKREKEAEREEQRKLHESGQATNMLAAALLSRPASPEIEFIRPLSDENQRLVNQGGLFTRGPLNGTLQKWVQANQDKSDEGYTLIKILIPNKDREECLKTLNRMNINHLTLFPDLYGASKFCNLLSSIKQY